MSNSTKSSKQPSRKAKRRNFPTWLSSRQSTVRMDTGSQGTSPLPDSKPLSMCQSLDDLLLSDFIKCHIDHDYSSLVVSGIPTPEQVAECWIALYSAYLIGINSADAVKYVEESANIEALNLKIVNVECLVVALSMQFSEELVECLRKWEYDFDFTEETIEKDLRRVIASLGNERTQLAIARNITQEEQENNGNHKPTRETYTNMLMQMSIHHKINPPYRANQITTSEFVFMYNQMQEYSRMIAKQQSHGID